MAPTQPPQPTVSQRVEELEDAMGNMEAKVTDLVSKTIEKAMVVMEGRVSRAREQQEGMIYAMKQDQDKFQEELRSTLTAFQSIHMATAERGKGVEPNGESSVKGGLYTPKGASSFGSPGLERGQFGGGSFGGNNGGGVQGNWRYRKLDMPLFDGGDPDGWILRLRDTLISTN